MKRRIIDCHCHLGSYFNFYVPGHSPEDMIRSMDNTEVEMACISPHMSLTSDIVGGNAFMLETVQNQPGRFIGFFTYNPHFPDLMKTELDKAFKIKGVKGIKIHQGTHGTNLMNPSYRYLYDFANRYHLPILIHTWDLQTINEISVLSGEYTNATFIMGHFGAVPSNMIKAADVIKSRKNVVGDTTVSMMYEGNIEWLVSMVGADKVLYGTDMPFIDPRVCLGRVLAAALSDSERERLLGQNIIRILEGVKDYEI